MSEIFNPKVRLPASPPIPEAPPEPIENENLMKKKQELSRKKGDIANLMTGGLGIQQISPQNIRAHTLGGYTPIGAA